MENWIKSDGANNNIVLSSRIRLARNLQNRAFPDKLSDEEGKQTVKTVEEAFYTSSHMKDAFKTVYLWNNDEITNISLVEKHLISPKLASSNKKSAFILDKDETISIMINEEDHIRLQCITAGLNLMEAYSTADKLDNLLEEKIEFAFDEKLGYLTACPTNVGTGMRASVMLHLPALGMNNGMNRILNAVAQVGMTIRGLYGEGSKAEGDFYQVSNQLTMGISEEDVLNNLNAVVGQIINQEIWAREQLMNSYRFEIEDKVQRSLGILKTAVLLNSNECLNLISSVRMGIEMGIINNVDIASLNSLLIDTRPATLQLMSKSHLTEKDRDYNRAKLVRERLNR